MPARIGNPDMQLAYVACRLSGSRALNFAHLPHVARRMSPSATALTARSWST